MLFNSIEFAIFLPIVFVLYWFVFNRNLKAQNAFVVAASYLFYGWWDWRFLLLIAFTSTCSWWSGLLIDRFRDSGNKAKWISGGNITLNLLILCLFKYYDFFAESFGRLFLGGASDSLLLHLILPVGISFYTFQALSYSIDVYRKNIEPTKDIIQFFAFVSFFPQLVAGPIERATNLLPQFGKTRTFDYHTATDGMRQILWGLFKKIVIADNCAIYVNEVYANFENYSGSTLLVAAVLFAFPLGGSRCSKAKIIRNTFVIFLLSGMWHGANWTFIVWGAYHALLFLPLILMGKNRRYRDTVAAGRLLPDVKSILKMALTFFLVTIGWVIFRADSIGQAWTYIANIFSPSLLTKPWHPDVIHYCHLFAFIALMLAGEWMHREDGNALQMKRIQPRAVRFLCYMLIVVTIAIFNPGEGNQFIYFQF